MEVKNFVWNVDQQVDKMVEEASSRHRHLEDVNKKWKTFDTLIESVIKWMEDAEGLIKNGTLKACKVGHVRRKLIIQFSELFAHRFSLKVPCYFSSDNHNKRHACCFLASKYMGCFKTINVYGSYRRQRCALRKNSKESIAAIKA